MSFLQESRNRASSPNIMQNDMCYTLNHILAPKNLSTINIVPAELPEAERPENWIRGIAYARFPIALRSLYDNNGVVLIGDGNVSGMNANPVNGKEMLETLLNGIQKSTPINKLNAYIVGGDPEQFSFATEWLTDVGIPIRGGFLDDSFHGTMPLGSSESTGRYSKTMIAIPQTNAVYLALKDTFNNDLLGFMPLQ